MGRVRYAGELRVGDRFLDRATNSVHTVKDREWSQQGRYILITYDDGVQELYTRKAEVEILHGEVHR